MQTTGKKEKASTARAAIEAFSVLFEYFDDDRNLCKIGLNRGRREEATFICDKPDRTHFLQRASIA
ncbi:MAG: hypothetical protein VB061_04040 [Christensenella sp.]|nr:hypothetical protein [Christensenella sp.]